MEINLGTFSQITANVFLTAIRFAIDMKHRFIGSEHLLWALIQDSGTAGQILREHGMDPSLIEDYLHQYDWDAKADGDYSAVQVSEEAEHVIHLAESYAWNHGNSQLNPEDLLYGILNASECAASQLMLSLEINLEEIRCVPSPSQPGRRNNRQILLKRKKLYWKNTELISPRRPVKGLMTP